MKAREGKWQGSVGMEVKGRVRKFRKKRREGG